MTKLTRDFSLEEFVKDGEWVDAMVTQNLRVLCATILQPMRDALQHPVLITSGYRRPSHNAAVGGVATSDHVLGCAADFQVRPVDELLAWEDATREAWTWIAKNCAGYFGQLIFEDHRTHTKNKNKLWVHVSIVSARHPGHDTDPNRMLFSYAPGEYHPTTEEHFA